MSDRSRNAEHSQALDELLKTGLTGLPPEAVVKRVTPWKKAMNRVLCGLLLCAVPLPIWCLNCLLPAAGLLCQLLGFRSLRRESRWFGACYALALVRACCFFASLVFNATILRALCPAPLTAAFRLLLEGLLLFGLFYFWCALEDLQQKSNIATHAGGAVVLILWHAATYLLSLFAPALANQTGVAGVVMVGAAGAVLLAGLLLTLSSLRKISAALEEAGYILRPSPAKLPDRGVVLLFAAFLLSGCALGALLFSNYPMDWQPLSKAEHRKAEAAAAHLESLGVPSSVLNDLLPEDIAACKGAQQAATDVKEYPVNGAILRLTTVLVQLPGEGESYRAFHHFEWEGSPGFCGTECLELLPIYDFSGLGFSSPPGSTVTGRVLYDKNGQTFASPYCKLGERSEASRASQQQRQSPWGIYAAFSFPNEGSAHRGYLSYSFKLARRLSANANSLVNYTHQKSLLQYPAVTAAETPPVWGLSPKAFETVAHSGLVEFRFTDESALATLK